MQAEDSSTPPLRGSARNDNTAWNDNTARDDDLQGWQSVCQSERAWQRVFARLTNRTGHAGCFSQCPQRSLYRHYTGSPDTVATFLELLNLVEERLP